MIEIHNILCPTDFSEPSRTATNYALEFARGFGAQLHLLHVIEDPVLFIPALGGYVPDSREIEAFAETGLENWIFTEDAGNVEITKRWVHGRPFAEILRDAEERDVDLIVMGTHGRGFLPHLLMGSVAERVVRHAPCPVLTVRHADEREESTAAQGVPA